MSWANAAAALAAAAIVACTGTLGIGPRHRLFTIIGVDSRGLSDRRTHSHVHRIAALDSLEEARVPSRHRPLHLLRGGWLLLRQVPM